MQDELGHSLSNRNSSAVFSKSGSYGHVKDPVPKSLLSQTETAYSCSWYEEALDGQLKQSGIFFFKAQDYLLFSALGL